ncbi:hypothetical protein WG66_004133 [Moniliophthora roreri]|nr:hypothetical protein WG66_004133 [Moniliophthora roreri]
MRRGFPPRHRLRIGCVSVTSSCSAVQDIDWLPPDDSRDPYIVFSARCSLNHSPRIHKLECCKHEPSLLSPINAFARTT